METIQSKYSEKIVFIGHPSPLPDSFDTWVPPDPTLSVWSGSMHFPEPRQTPAMKCYFGGDPKVSSI